jgi:hypothetical protein
MQRFWDLYYSLTRGPPSKPLVLVDSSQLDAVSRHAQQLSYRTSKVILDSSPETPRFPVVGFSPAQVESVCPRELQSCLKQVEQTLREIADSHSQFDGMVLHAPGRALAHFDRTGHTKHLFGLKCQEP